MKQTDSYTIARSAEIQDGRLYSVVRCRDATVMYRVHMVRSMHDATLFRLNTDVWLDHL